MKQLPNLLQDYFSGILDAIPVIIAGAVVLVFFFFIGRIVAHTAKKMFGPSKQITKKRKITIVVRFIRWIFYSIGFIIALNIMGLTDAAKSVLAAGGILTVVLGFAFREIGENLLAGMFMSFSPIFDVGDLIESNGTRGVVQRINIRDVHIRTADGVDSFLPSAMIYKNQLHNYTRDGLRRAGFKLFISYTDNPQVAHDLILEVLKNTTGVLDTPKPSVRFADFAVNHIILECFLWVSIYSEHSSLSNIRTDAMQNVRAKLLEEGFSLSHSQILEKTQ